MPKAKSPNFILKEFVPAISLLMRRLRSNTPARNRDFSHTQKSVLSRLEREGPATSADLARAEGVRPQSMGTAIAALEQLKLVERKPHPKDGRQVNLVITKKGLQHVLASREAHHAWFAKVVGDLSKPEREALQKAAAIIKKLAES